MAVQVEQVIKVLRVAGSGSLGGGETFDGCDRVLGVLAKADKVMVLRAKRELEELEDEGRRLLGMEMDMEMEFGEATGILKAILLEEWLLQILSSGVGLEKGLSGGDGQESSLGQFHARGKVIESKNFKGREDGLLLNGDGRESSFGKFLSRGKVIQSKGKEDEGESYLHSFHLKVLQSKKLKEKEFNLRLRGGGRDEQKDDWPLKEVRVKIEKLRVEQIGEVEKMVQWVNLTDKVNLTNRAGQTYQTRQTRQTGTPITVDPHALHEAEQLLKDKRKEERLKRTLEKPCSSSNAKGPCIPRKRGHGSKKAIVQGRKKWLCENDISEEPLNCSVPGCLSEFPRRSTRYRHLRETHGFSKKVALKLSPLGPGLDDLLGDLVCSIPPCSEKFGSSSLLCRHLRKVHRFKKDVAKTLCPQLEDDNIKDLGSEGLVASSSSDSCSSSSDEEIPSPSPPSPMQTRRQTRPGPRPDTKQFSSFTEAEHVHLFGRPVVHHLGEQTDKRQTENQDKPDRGQPEIRPEPVDRQTEIHTEPEDRHTEIQSDSVETQTETETPPEKRQTEIQTTAEMQTRPGPRPDQSCLKDAEPEDRQMEIQTEPVERQTEIHTEPEDRQTEIQSDSVDAQTETETPPEKRQTEIQTTAEMQTRPGPRPDQSCLKDTEQLVNGKRKEHRRLHDLEKPCTSSNAEEPAAIDGLVKKEFGCPGCSSAFSRRSSLVKHLHSKHDFSREGANKLVPLPDGILKEDLLSSASESSSDGEDSPISPRMTRVTAAANVTFSALASASDNPSVSVSSFVPAFDEPTFSVDAYAPSSVFVYASDGFSASDSVVELTNQVLEDCFFTSTAVPPQLPPLGSPQFLPLLPSQSSPSVKSSFVRKLSPQQSPRSSSPQFPPRGSLLHGKRDEFNISYERLDDGLGDTARVSDDSPLAGSSIVEASGSFKSTVAKQPTSSSPQQSPRSSSPQFPPHGSLLHGKRDEFNFSFESLNDRLGDTARVSEIPPFAGSSIVETSGSFAKRSKSTIAKQPTLSPMGLPAGNDVENLGYVSTTEESNISRKNKTLKREKTVKHSKCPLCSLLFAQSFNARRHLQQIHNIPDGDPLLQQVGNTRKGCMYCKIPQTRMSRHVKTCKKRKDLTKRPKENKTDMEKLTEIPIYNAKTIDYGGKLIIKYYQSHYQSVLRYQTISKYTSPLKNLFVYWEESDKKFKADALIWSLDTNVFLPTLEPYFQEYPPTPSTRKLYGQAYVSFGKFLQELVLRVYNGREKFSVQKITAAQTQFQRRTEVVSNCIKHYSKGAQLATKKRTSEFSRDPKFLKFNPTLMKTVQQDVLCLEIRRTIIRDLIEKTKDEIERKHDYIDIRSALLMSILVGCCGQRQSAICRMTIGELNKARVENKTRQIMIEDHKTAKTSGCGILVVSEENYKATQNFVKFFNCDSDLQAKVFRDAGESQLMRTANNWLVKNLTKHMNSKLTPSVWRHSYSNWANDLDGNLPAVGKSSMSHTETTFGKNYHIVQPEQVSELVANLIPSLYGDKDAVEDDDVSKNDENKDNGVEEETQEQECEEDERANKRGRQFRRHETDLIKKLFRAEMPLGIGACECAANKDPQFKKLWEELIKKKGSQRVAATTIRKSLGSKKK